MRAIGVDPRPSRRRWIAVGTALFLLAAVGVVLQWPVATRQGINYEVAIHHVPLYLKASEFVSRSAQYSQIAHEIVRNAATDEARALALFEWSVRNVRDVPHGFPVIDDHILNIIIRGYGTADQRADVFATLAVYAGVRAFWAKIPGGLPAPGVIVTFVEIDGRWCVFDAGEGIVFRDESGRLATLADLAKTPALIPAAVGDRPIDERDSSFTYLVAVTKAPMPRIPRPLRAELQMPALRLWHEVKEAIGVEADDESER